MSREMQGGFWKNAKKIEDRDGHFECAQWPACQNNCYASLKLNVLSRVGG